MARWADVEREEPELAARARAMIERGRHRTIATLRADGSPRISGIECEFVDGDLRFGSMPGARKGADLRRDPRFALHGPTVDPVEGMEAQWPGEAKIAGLARRVQVDGDVDGAGGEQFLADITEVVLTSLDPAATRLVVEWWTPASGRRRVERD